MNLKRIIKRAAALLLGASFALGAAVPGSLAPASVLAAETKKDTKMTLVINEEQTIEGLNSATTTVEEALAAGSFSTGNHLAFFTMTSLDADQTMITTGMYTPDIMSWDDFKTYYPDAKEIGDTNVPGLLYHVEAISGQSVAVAVKVSDDVTLQIVYEGSLEDEIGEDELGQRLYNLVTVK